MTSISRTLIILVLALLLPVSSSAELASFFDEPDTVFASNTVIDIIEHNGGVWFATGEGVNFSFDSGQTWLLYNASNGLVGDNISALYSTNGRIWVASNHESDNITLSDGLTYSDDNGYTWTQVNFGPDGLNIPHVWGGDRTIFDITGYYDTDRDLDWLFFTAFAGGFLASQDGGLSWRRIFPSHSDSLNFDSVLNVGIEPSLRNRYFSCGADTSHGDTLYVWAGTAGGLFQYVYASPRDKPFSRRINRIAFCDQCSDSAGSFVFIGGDNGVTRGTTSGAPFISRFAPDDGLPGPYVSALIDFRGRLLVGTMNAGGAISTGLAVSTDHGDTYTALLLFTEVIGTNRKISDFAVIRERLYMAAEEAGLFMSRDSGETWSHIYVDSSDTASVNRRNVVHALDALVDTLRVGTDSGLVTLYLDSTGQIDSSRFHVFAEGVTSSTKVIRVKTQLFYDSTGVTYDSLAIWTVNRPVDTLVGSPAVFRSYGLDTLEHDTLFSAGMQVGVNTNDINFLGDSAFAVGEAGLRFTVTGKNPSLIYDDQVKDSTGTDNFDNDIITVMAVRGDTIFIGSDNGFAISHNRSQEFTKFKIYRVNTDSLGADFVVNYASNVFGITGDFMPALGVQYMEDEPARIWVSNRPAFSGSEGISVGLVLPDTVDQVVTYDRVWESVYHDGFAWNFAFNGDSVFAATDGGLLFNHQDTGLTWDTIPLVDISGNPLAQPEAAVYAVEVIDNFLWVGTEDRTVRVNLFTLIADSSFYVVDFTTPPDQVYAFPIPFSHSGDLAVDFHFAVKREAEITLEIYDFAMNLVTRVIDNQAHPPGIYPAEGAFRRTWDGRNDRGKRVAVGVYYFKVEYSTGEIRWGKLAVIP